MEKWLAGFRFAGWLCGALFALGCSGNPEPEDTADPCALETPAVSIGDGEYTWAGLSAGQEVVMVHGPQGGWHVLASIWTENLGALVTIDYVITATDFEGYVIADDTYRVAMVTDDACGGFYPGIYGYLEVGDLADGELDTPPEVLSYSNLQLSLTVTDTNERVASNVIDVIALPDPQDVDLVPGDTGVDE